MSLKKQVITGVKWTFLQQFSVQLISFCVQIMLARLLAPEMFGLIAMVIVFVSIGQTLMDSGMTSSLIRTKEPDQLDYSTVFVTNLLMSLVVYGIVYFSAPSIALFYNQDEITDILRVFSLSFVIRALVAVHLAKLTKEMNFKLQMKLEIPSTIVSGIVGVGMAYNNYGVWSLVWLNLIQAIIFTVLSWIFINWRPSLVFNKQKFKYHFKFGYKLTLSGLLDTIYNNSYSIVIGKFFPPASVGFFYQAETMRLFPVMQISSVIGKVTYPFFANINNDQTLKNAYRKTMKLVIFITLPLMLSLNLVAEEGFMLLFGEKWLPAVPYFQILVFASIVRPLSAYNLNVLKVKDRSDLFLLVEVIKKIVGVLLLVLGLYFGVIGLVISLVLFSFISYFINMFFSGRLINYSIWEQLHDILTMLVIGFVLYGIMYKVTVLLRGYNPPELLFVMLSITVFFTFFACLSLLFDKELKNIILNLKR